MEKDLRLELTKDKQKN